jgi:serine/threonine-protein kinase
LEKTPEDILPLPAHPPLRLGKYSLLRELGRGAMGVVYEAEDTETRRRVALKVLIAPPSMDPRELKPEEERFLREARLSALLPPHPAIVRVHEAGREDGKCYLVMDLVKGLSISEWRKQGSSTIRQNITLLRDAALAVHFAHEHGIIHRDLKPENILVDEERSAHITDFGLAKATGAGSPMVQSATGLGVGTPYYMSPEQVQGRRDIDRRTDIYSLGVMLYEILAGRRPFEGKTPFEVMTHVLRSPVRPPSKLTRLQINPFLYKNLENICLIAMEKDPSDRYSDARSFANDLTRWLKGDDFQVIVPRSWRRLRGKRTLRMGLLALGAVALLGVLGAALLLRAQGRTDPGEPAKLPAVVLRAPDALRRGALAEAFLGINFNALAVQKIDERADFDEKVQPLWAEAPAYLVSIRWTGLLEVPQSGRYVFEAKGPDGIRLRVDGVELISKWGQGPTAVEEAHCGLERGLHRLTFEHAREGMVQPVGLYWKPEASRTISKLGPGSLLHDPSEVKKVPPVPPGLGESTAPPQGAVFPASLQVVEFQGSQPELRTPDDYRPYWRGRGLAAGHLWWGPSVAPGDRLRLHFPSKVEGRFTVVVAFTRASDHGVFRVCINGAPVAGSLDLYSPHLEVYRSEFPQVPVKKGENELEITAVGSNSSAREWLFAGGLHKVGIAYIQVR